MNSADFAEIGQLWEADKQKLLANKPQELIINIRHVLAYGDNEWQFDDGTIVWYEKIKDDKILCDVRAGLRAFFVTGRMSVRVKKSLGVLQEPKYQILEVLP